MFLGLDVLLTCAFFPDDKFSKIGSEIFGDFFEEVFVVFVVNFLVIGKRLRIFFHRRECWRGSTHKRFLPWWGTCFWAWFIGRVRQGFKFGQGVKRSLTFRCWKFWVAMRKYAVFVGSGWLRILNPRTWRAGCLLESTTASNRLAMSPIICVIFASFIVPFWYFSIPSYDYPNFYGAFILSDYCIKNKTNYNHRWSQSIWSFYFNFNLNFFKSIWKNEINEIKCKYQSQRWLT